MARRSLRQVLLEARQCVVAPCVYDCASARAVEMVGFPALMLSGGEVSIAMNGVIDYGFTNLTDLEWITSRISRSTPLPLAADIEDGFGGPLAIVGNKVGNRPTARLPHRNGNKKQLKKKELKK